MKKPVFFVILSLILMGCGTEPLLEEASLVYPIENFESDITLKSFGSYITPASSPVQPERFSGYHTGVDVEAGDLKGEVPVLSIAAGKVVLARTVDGYGGVVVVQYSFDEQPILALYGHLDIASVVVAVGDPVVLGQELGVLGEGYTDETDGERKHLHFALIPGETLSLLGYVQSEEALSGWLDPVIFFEERL